MIVLEYEGSHYELDVKKQLVKYHNVISPQDADMNFPQGYFDEKTSNIDPDGIYQMAIAFNSLITKGHMESDLLPLPVGATRNAYMRIMVNGATTYYTNTHVCQNRFCVESDSILDDFIPLVRLLDGYCVFPQCIGSGTPINYPNDVVNHLKRIFTADDVERIFEYRYSATGVFEYEFYSGNNKIGTVSNNVLPSYGITWKSKFEHGTIYPGITRYVYDGITSNQIAKLVYRALGKYEINDSVYVYCDTEKYLFFCDDEIVAQINKFNDEMKWMSESIEYEYKTCFETLVPKGINAGLKMIILSFPMFEF